MYEYPVIRLELQSMKHSVVNALSAYHSDVERTVSQQLDEVIKNFDFGAVVQSTATEALNKAIKTAVESYFMYGRGRAMVDKIVADILSGGEEQSDGTNP